MPVPASTLPQQGDLGPWVRASEAICLAVAGTLVVANGVRLGSAGALAEWWTLPLLLATLAAADFITGCIHWFADTWGTETMPILGQRLIRPFRIHHVNPDDFLDRSFVDANGDVAMLNLPVLAAALFVPVATTTGQILALGMASLAMWVLPTNQVHQWAHRATAPAAVAWLQRRGIILSPARHQHHHTAPFVSDYCILTGWCNAPLARIGFFRKLERMITAVTGVDPRSEDGAYAASVGSRR